VIPFIRPRGVVQAVTQVAVELQPVILALAAEEAEAAEDIWAAAVVVPTRRSRVDIMQDRLAVAVAVRHTGVRLSRTSIRESEVPECTFSSMVKVRSRERSHKWEYC
jgi:tRNA(Phe) wybutosine-synthesizing methylase Tyw3